jgi:hypothetical protein
MGKLSTPFPNLSLEQNIKCNFQMQHQYCEREKKEMVAKLEASRF